MDCMPISAKSLCYLICPSAFARARKATHDDQRHVACFTALFENDYFFRIIKKQRKCLRQANPVEESDRGLIAKEGCSISWECTSKHRDEALVQCTNTVCFHEVNKHTANAVLVLAW